MSAGNQPSWQGINSQAGLIAVTFRNNFAAVDILNSELDYIVANGGLSSLSGYTDTADANVLTAGIGNMETLSQAYQGLGTIPSEVDFRALTVGLWGIA